MHTALSSFLTQLEANGPLRGRDRDAILALPSHIQTFQSEARVVHQGDREGDFLVLVEGLATRQKLTGDGARQLLSLHILGDTLNPSSLFLPYADYDIVALRNAKIAIIPRAPMLDLLTASPSIMQALCRLAFVDAAIGREALLRQGRRDAKARVAHFICEYLSRMQARGVIIEGAFVFPLTQEQLGDAVGLTSIHVNRTYNKLVSEGLIIQKGRSFEIPNIGALRIAGDFNDQYLFI